MKRRRRLRKRGSTSPRLVQAPTEASALLAAVVDGFCVALAWHAVGSAMAKSTVGAPVAPALDDGRTVEAEGIEVVEVAPGEFEVMPPKRGGGRSGT